MSRLEWDKEGEHLYETGTKRGVVWVMGDTGYGKGIVWNGITGVTKSPGGAEPNDVYADDIKYLSLLSAETFAYTIECLNYPDEFAECNGLAEATPGVTIGQQDRKAFAFSFTSTFGNDTKGNKYGKKIHIFYNSKCSPSDSAYTTINESPETITFSFECNCTPVKVTADSTTCSVEIDSTEVDPDKFAAFEDIIYGTDATEEHYVVTADTVMDSSKTYYEKTGETTYTETSDVTFDPEKTYYEKIPATIGTDSRLPMPSEIIEFFRPAA